MTARARRIAVLVLAAATATATVAGAGAEPAAPRQLLADARAALDELRYEDASQLLERAAGTGACRPDDLSALYRMSAQIAVTVGDGDRGQRDFVRMLSLDPDAHLAEGTSPKILARFDAARAAVREAGPLRVDLTARAAAVTGAVASDPAGLVAGLRASWPEAGARRTALAEVDADGAIQLDVPVQTATEVDLHVVDRHGNVLVETTVTVSPRASDRPRSIRAAAATPPREAGLAASARAGAPAADRPLADRPLYRRWPVWAGAAVGFAAVGLVFALESRSAQDSLDSLNSSSGAHQFTEADAVEDRLRRDALLANVGFALAAGSGLAAVAFGVQGEF